MARDSKQGLLERSRKFLGGSRRTIPTGDFQHDSANSKEPSPELTAYQRRRDQVRRAQRSHRERKENYIKGLEQEILELRENHAGSLRDFQAQIAYLKNFIHAHGLQLSEHWKAEAAKGTGFNPSLRSAMASIAQSGVPSRFLQISRQDQSYQPNISDSSGAPLFNSVPLDGIRYPFAQSNIFTDTQGGGESSPSHSGAEDTMSPQMQDLTIGSTSNKTGYEYPTQNQEHQQDTLSVGIDFVLTLEHVCMDHLEEVQPSTSTEPSNHALMASHQILAHRPAEMTPDSTWPIPETIIENLLAMSSQLGLSGEMTPVQAWHKLYSHPEFKRLDRKNLEALKQVMAQEVKCFGFGAVMETAVFDIALEELLKGRPLTAFDASAS